MTLTNEYQYIGRSTPVGCSAGYGYYLLVYAAGTPQPEQGGYRVGIKTLLACDADASFYGFATTASAFLGGQLLYSWERRQLPEEYWGDSEPFTAGDVLYSRWTELASRETLIPGTLAGAELTLRGSWVMESALDRDWFPNTGEKAVFEFPVTLSPVVPETEVTVKSPVVFDGAPAKVEVTVNNPVPDCVFKVELGICDYLLNECEVKGAGKYSVELDPALWVELMSLMKDTYQLSDEQAPFIQVTAMDEKGNVLSQARQRVDMVVTEAYAPRIGEVTLTTGNVMPEPFSQLCIQDRSYVRAQVESEGVLGASIMSCEMIVEGCHYQITENNCKSHRLQGWGDINVRIRVTDSRGHSSIRDSTVHALPYTKPELRLYDYGRCDAQGNFCDDGTYLYLRTTGKSASVGDLENPCCLELQWVEIEEGKPRVYTDWIPLTEMTAGEFTYAKIPEGVVLDPAKHYGFWIRCRDTVGGVAEASFSIGSQEVYMHRTGRGLGIGKYVEEPELVDCRWNVCIRGELRLGEQGVPLEDYIRSIVEEYNGNL